MCTAAHLSGRAIDVSATTAPHALSFHLTTAYGVPHGHAVALTLGAVLEYNAGVTGHDCADPRGPEHVHRVVADVLDVLDVDSAHEANTALSALVAAVGLEPTLAGVGVADASSRRRLAHTASPIRLATNPRRFTETGLERLIASIP
jgi:alcohol dehydrogenase class IV